MKKIINVSNIYTLYTYTLTQMLINKHSKVSHYHWACSENDICFPIIGWPKELYIYNDDRQTDWSWKESKANFQKYHIIKQ